MAQTKESGLQSRQSKTKRAETQTTQPASDAPEQPRNPVKEILVADPVKAAKEWVWQFLEVLADIAGGLSIIGGFDSFHERQFAADPNKWKGADPFGWLRSVCRFDLRGLWFATIDETVSLHRILHHGRDRIYGAGLPLEEVKDQIEWAMDILLDVSVAGEAMRREWRDIVARRTGVTVQDLVNEILPGADEFAQHVRCLQSESKLKEVICHLRGYAVRGRTRKKPWDKSRKGFIPLTLAHQRYCTSGIAPKLPYLSKCCKPDGPFDYMRKPGKGVLVDEQQFAARATEKNYTEESVQKAKALVVTHEKSSAGLRDRLRQEHDMDWGKVYRDERK